MGSKIKIIGFFFFLFFAFLAVESVEAHSGRTARDGCHYCRTNCDSWGVAWNQRHCHAKPQVAPAVSATTPGVDNLTSAVATVVRVIDGDTVKATISGQTYSVRLIGINAPERAYSTTPAECFSQQAKTYLTSLLQGRTVILRKDILNSNKDRYGRLLRYVELNGEDINAKMVRNGYAYAYTRFSFSRNNLYVGSQNRAREEQIGIWTPGVC